MQKLDSVMSRLKELREIWYIILTTGYSNINVEFIVKDHDELNDLVYNKTGSISGITRLETSITMTFEKRNYEYGTPLS